MLTKKDSNITRRHFITFALGLFFSPYVSYLYNLPPHNIEAEKYLISAILWDNNTLDDIVGIISPDDFYKTAHEEIYNEMLDLYAKDDHIDLVTLWNNLNEKDKMEKIGGLPYLIKLVDFAPSPSSAKNSKHYAKIVHEIGKDRKAWMVMLF